MIIDGELHSFAPAGLTEYKIPNYVTSIGAEAFRGNKKLLRVTIPIGVISIGDWAFMDCVSLTDVIIPNNVTQIAEKAFNGCTSLTNITIPDKVLSIGDYAFCSCRKLTSITIGNNVASIGNGVFCYCRYLTSIYCKATTPPMIGTGSFGKKSGLKIYVPKSEGSTVLKGYKSAIADCYSNGYSAPSWEYYDGIIEEYDFNNE
mgnify:FL=1